MKHVHSIKLITFSLCAMLALLLVLGNICPVQASTEFPVVNYRNDSSLTVSEIRSYGTQFATSYYAIQNTNDSITTYMFAVPGDSAFNLVVFSDSSSSYSISNAGPSGNLSPILVYQAYNELLYGVSSYTFTDPLVPTFDSVESGLNEYLNPTPDSTSSFNLPYGNVAVLDLTRTTISLDLSAVFQEKSALFGTPFESFGYWGTMATLPSDGQTFSQADSTSIVWERGYPRDLLGQTRNAVSTIESTSLDRYLYIVNPYTSSPSPDGILPSITVSGIPQGVVVYKYPLSSTLNSYGNVIATLDDTSAGGSGEATASGGAINFTDGNGDVYTSPDGGLNTPSESVQSVVDYVNSISKTLDNFVEAFLNLLKAPISHIQQLVNSGSAFMQSLSTMFTWLPEPVQAVITSGLVLLVVIGVLKLLL